MAQTVLRPTSQLLNAKDRRRLCKVTGSQAYANLTQLLVIGPATPIRKVFRPQLVGRRVVACSAQQEPPATPEQPAPPTPAANPASDNSQMLFSLGIAALWIGLLVYAVLLAPNQTPYRDQIFIQRILGLGEADGFVVNPVFVSLFSIMGIYPAVFAALLVPGGRSRNKVPAWPFVTLSFAFGAFALLPYMALWRPYTRPQDNPLPPPASELQGWTRLFMRGAETPVMPAVLLAGAVYFVAQAVTSDGDVWLDFLKLFDESRLVHVSSLDFATLTALAPFWMEHDAAGRNWARRSQLLPVLSLLPVIGPCLYLLLRPKTKM